MIQNKLPTKKVLCCVAPTNRKSTGATQHNILATFIFHHYSFHFAFVSVTILAVIIVGHLKKVSTKPSIQNHQSKECTIK